MFNVSPLTLFFVFLILAVIITMVIGKTGNLYKVDREYREKLMDENDLNNPVVS